MIIGSTRIQTSSGPEALIRHVFYGPKNEDIELIQGSEDCIRDAWADASQGGSKFALRHWHLNPAEPLDESQFMGILSMLADEFGFDPGSATVLQHTKKRADVRLFDHHWHVVVPEFNPVTRKVLSSSWSYARQEKISRLVELRFGHSQVIGKFQKAVVSQLQEDGHFLEASEIEENQVSPPPLSAYTSEQKQIADRNGHDIAEVRKILASGWEQTSDLNDLNKYLSEFNLQVSQGDKAFILETRDQQLFFGSVSRLLKLKKYDVEKRFIQQEINYEGKQIIKGVDHNGSARFVRRDLELKHADSHEKGYPRPQPDSVRSHQGGDELGRPGEFVDALGKRDFGGAADVGSTAPNRRLADPNRRTPAISRIQTLQLQVALEQAGQGSQRSSELARLTRRLNDLGQKADFKARRARLNGFLHQDEKTGLEALDGLDFEAPAFVSVTPVYRTPQEQEERRARWVAASISREYGLGWVDAHDELVSPVRSIVSTDAGVVWNMKSGNRLVDGQDAITAYGSLDQDAIEQIIRLIEVHGWSEVEVSGSLEFCQAIETALAERLVISPGCQPSLVQTHIR